jgi:molybdopterin converting factor small subunit
MIITVTLFAEARDIVGMRSIELEIAADTCSVQQLLDALVAGPGTQLGGRVLVADDDGRWMLVNGYRLMVRREILPDPASWEACELADGDEVGILPPFSGG